MSGLTAKPLLLIWGRGSAEREPLKDLVAVVQAIGLAHSKDGAVLLLARISCDSANTAIAGRRSLAATTETVKYAG